MNIHKRLNNKFFSLLILTSLLGLFACSSPEDKAEKYYENGMRLLEKGELIKANVEFKNALQLNNKLTKAVWGQVLVAEKQNNHRLLFGLLKEVIKRQPEHLQANIKISRIYLMADKVDDALEKSEVTMRINDKDLSVLSLRAAIMLKMKKMDLAIELANQVLKQDPNYIDAILILASERFSSGDLEASLKYINQGLSTDKKNVSLNLIKIKVLESARKFDLAEDVYKNLIKYYPDTNGYVNLLVQFYHRHNRTDDAINTYQSYIKENPEDIKSKLSLVKYINIVRGVDAGFEQLEKFSKESPDNNELKIELIRGYLFYKKEKMAVSELEKLINSGVDTEVALKAKGMLASLELTKGNKQSGLKLIKEILAVDKKNKSALLLKASLNIDLQKYDDAISDLRLIIRDTPDESAALLMLAKAHNLSGSPELADENYYKALKSSGFNLKHGIAYIQFLLKRNKSKRAEKIIQDMLAVNPGNLTLLNMLAQAKLADNDWDSANKIADLINKIDANNAVVQQIKNNIYIGKGEYAKSIDFLKESYKKSADNKTITSLIKSYMLANKADEAEVYLDKLLLSEPGNVLLKMLKANVYAGQAKFADAKTTYENVIKSHPKIISSYVQLSALQLRDGKIEDAEKILKQGLENNPENYSLNMALAGLYERKGHVDKAINIYEKLIKQKPDSDIVANNLASLLLDNRSDQKQYERAYKLSQRFRGSEIPQFINTFGWANYRLARYNDAELFLNKAVKIMPDVPEFHYHLAMNSLASKNKLQAEKEFKTALKFAKDEKLVTKIRAGMGQL